MDYTRLARRATENQLNTKKKYEKNLLKDGWILDFHI